MLADLHGVLTRLIHSYGSIPSAEVDVSFETPSREWLGALTRPTIDFFLIGVEENTELRQPSMDPIRGNGTAGWRLAPRRFDLQYLVTAPTTSVEDEHLLLWRTLVTLLKYPEYPDDVLPEALRSVDPPISGRVVKPEENARPLDVWSALEAPPRPSLVYAVTVPVDLEVEFTAPLVLTRSARYLHGATGSVAATGTHVGGVVRRRSGGPLAGVSVSQRGRGIAAQTDERGRFVLPGVPLGRVTLTISLGGGDVREYTIEVPSESYEVVVD